MVRSLKNSGRKLKTQRFSKSCLFNQQNPLAIENLFNGLPLLIVKTWKFERFLKDYFGFGSGHGVKELIP